MGDSQAAFFFRHDEGGCIDCLTLAFAVSHASCRFDTVHDDQLMHFTHGSLLGEFIHKCKWDSTDAGY
jgi:hypothetical protein